MSQPCEYFYAMIQKYTYGNMAKRELICVRVDSLLRSKDGMHTKSDVKVVATCGQK